LGFGGEEEGQGEEGADEVEVHGVVEV
jgi:hypothetical protein